MHTHTSPSLPPSMAATLVLSLLLWILLPSCAGGGGNMKEAQVNGMFVFGSSLVDNGNNNFLSNSTARADYQPYGIDFPWGPSGRFSNGRNPIDVLGELLHLPSLIPPFADPRTGGARIVHGVNFASGGSGILDNTGSTTGQVMSLNSQISRFANTTLPELKDLLGFDQLSNRQLSKYLFVLGTGGNDFLLNYFSRHIIHNPSTLSAFTRRLISALSAQLKRLYELGARKFVVFSVQAMGCIPLVRTNGSCIEAMNEAALVFNAHLRRLAGASSQWRSTQMPGSTVVFVNSYKIIGDIINNPIRSGFSETSKACCELSSAAEEGKGVLCRRGGSVCSVRDSHVFFDGLHPTDAVNVRIARKAYGSYRKAEAYPMNVRDLARLSI